MSQTYQSRRRAQARAAEQKPHIDAPGPSLSELAAGAMPSTEQMGHRVDLPEAIREKMEASFGADFSGVKVYESQTVADAGAQAMTMGSNVAFAPGKLDLASTSGQALLGHELSHVVSQARGESAGQGFLADAGLEAQADRQGALAAQGESVYSGPVTPLSASAVPASAGPIQAAGKSLDEDDLDELAHNDAAENQEGLITTANLPSRFHFIKRRRALDQLRRMRAARLAAMRPTFPDPDSMPELPSAFTLPESPASPFGPEDPFGAANSEGAVEMDPEQQASMQAAATESQEKAAKNLEKLEALGFDNNTPVGGGSGLTKEQLAELGDDSEGIPVGNGNSSLEQQVVAQQPYSAANVEGVVLRTEKKQEELQENKAAAEDKAAENLEKLEEQGFDNNTPVGGGSGLTKEQLAELGDDSEGIPVGSGNSSLEQQVAAQQPYGAANIKGAVVDSEPKKKKRRRRKKKAQEKTAENREKLEALGFDNNTPVGGGGGSLEQQVVAQQPYSAVNAEGPVVPTEKKQEEIQENKAAAQEKTAENLEKLEALGFNKNNTVGGGSGLTLEQQQRETLRAQKEQKAQDGLKIFADEKARRGYEPEQSYTGIAEYDNYLAAALPFHNEEEQKELMDAFRQGNQKPETVGLLIRNDMKRVSDAIKKKNRKNLLSKDRDKALDAHADLRGSQILADSIEKVLQKAADWESLSKRGGKDPSGGVAKYLKPDGKFAKTFQKRKVNFDKEMADLRRFRT